MLQSPLFYLSNEQRKSPNFIEIQGFTSFFFLKKWCHQESNRGHKDFQSFALPTELWHRCLGIADAKVVKVLDCANDWMEKTYSMGGFVSFSSFNGFHPWAFSSNSCPSRVMRAQPNSGLVMWPISFTPSMSCIFSWSAMGTVNSSS